MKIRTVPALFALLMMTSLGAEAANDQNIAIKAARDAGCIARNENQLSVTVEALSVCFTTGTIRAAHVFVTACEKCEPGSIDKRPVATKLKADVILGCDDDVMEVICY